MAKSNSLQRHEYWQQQMEQWQQSGLSGLKYCKQHHLSYHRFSYWRSKLSRIEGGENELSNPTPSASSFVKVVQREERTPDLVITLPNGITLQGITTDHIPLISQLMQQ